MTCDDNMNSDGLTFAQKFIYLSQLHMCMFDIDCMMNGLCIDIDCIDCMFDIDSIRILCHIENLFLYLQLLKTI